MNSARINYSSHSPWEPLRGYSRAVQLGNRLLISGTTALSETGEIVGIGDPYEQARFVIEYARKILSKAEFSINDVVLTRMFITDIKHWQDYAKAHSEAFQKIRPVSSIMQIGALVDPRLLVEMEFEAVKEYSLVESKKI